MAVNLFIILAILFSIASWGFLGLTFTNLLSGYFENRTCLTECVRGYYFAAAGTGLVGFLMAIAALLRSGYTGWLFLVLIFTLLPLGIVAGIFTMGTIGPMIH
jgi:hypothetical protein